MSAATKTSPDEYRSLTYARKNMIPKNDGRPLTAPTVLNWYTRGVCGQVLDVLFIGGVPHVTQKMLDDFFRRVTEAKKKKMRQQSDGVAKQRVTA
jgi:hypothetical protein